MTDEQAEELIEQLDRNWRFFEYTDAWRALSAEEQIEHAKAWLDSAVHAR